MVQKRQHGEDGGDDSKHPNKRQPFLSGLFKGTNTRQSLEEATRMLEPFIRRCVREEVESLFDQRVRCNPNQHGSTSSVSRTLQLQFRSNLPQTLFTNSRVVADDGSPITFVLYDSISQEIVTSGQLSSIKVKIVVLDADFGPDDEEDWTKNDFERKIVQNREGKRPLVTGDLVIALQNGVGSIGEICFTDNSSWIRRGKFRLGAKVHSVIGNVSIKEGMSNPFKVKDHRGESYKKHYPPSLHDDVWRLEKIAKDGSYHRKLTDSGVLSVEAFLRAYYTNMPGLRSMLPNISNKTWETITGHATSCIVDGLKYVYATAEGISLLFNTVYKVIGVAFDGKNYQSVDSLNLFQKGTVENLRQRACLDLNNLVPVTDAPMTSYPMLLASPVANNFSNQNSGFLGNNFLEQDQLETHMNTDNQSQESSSFDVGESSRQAPGFNSTFGDGFGIMHSPAFLFGGGNTWAPGANYMGSHLTTDDIPVDDSFQVDSSTWHVNGLNLGVYSSNSGNLIPRNRSPRTRWCKALAAIKWWILVKRKVTARKLNRMCNHI